MNRSFEIRSDEVQDILTHIPHWIIRTGIVLIGVLILVAITMAWFIKYPDSISGNLVLTTEIPTIKLTSQTSGKVVKLAAADGSFVSKGQALLEIKSAANYDDVERIRQSLSEISSFLNGQMEQFELINIAQPLGSIQASYNELFNHLSDYKALTTDKNFINERRAIENKLQNHREYLDVLRLLEKYANNEASIATERYEMNKTLFGSGAISKSEYLNYQEALVRAEKTVTLHKTSIIESRMTLTDYQNQWKSLTVNYDEKKRVLLQQIDDAHRRLKNSIEEWSQEHTIFSPIDGQLFFGEELFVNKHVNSNSPLFVIVPHGSSLKGLISINQQGIGKIRKNDKVLVRFSNYPYQEYGRVVASVKEISSIPSNSQYFVITEFPDGLMSTFNKKISFKPEMEGEAEILTNDLRLLERFYYQIFALGN